MVTLKIPYETGEETGVYLELDVPQENLLFEAIPKEPEPIEDLVSAVEKAVDSPIECPSYSELIGKAGKVTFITENQYRAAPARDILPPLIKKANQAKCEISIVVGGGTMPPLTRDEMKAKLGEDVVSSGIPIFCNDVREPEKYKYIGVTRAGTPLFVHEVVTEADVVITISTTQATPWGYGGAGMIIPAVVDNVTTEINHMTLLAPDCIVGNNDCLMQLDKYEALELANVQMSINVIVDNQKRVIFLNAGSPVRSHKEAVERYNEIYEFSIPALSQQKADIAITGSTAATNHFFFHTGWAVSNCGPAVRNGGIIIMASPCKGYGGLPGFTRMEILRDYLPASKENQGKAIRELYKRIVSGKWAFTWYKIYEVMPEKNVWLVTDKANMSLCNEIGLTAYESIEEAYKEAIKRIGNDAKVAFIPFGRYTIIKEGS